MACFARSEFGLTPSSGRVLISPVKGVVLYRHSHLRLTRRTPHDKIILFKKAVVPQGGGAFVNISSFSAKT